MFVKANIGLGAGSAAITVPTSAIQYAPYGDSVYVVEQVTGPKGTSTSACGSSSSSSGAPAATRSPCSTGVKNGETVVTSGVFKLRNGAAVKVNNAAQPGNNPAPKPEDN